MYDFAMIKGRIQKEMQDVAGCCKWNPDIVCILEKLLKGYKYIQEIEKMEWDQHQRMAAHQ